MERKNRAKAEIECGGRLIEHLPQQDAVSLNLQSHTQLCITAQPALAPLSFEDNQVSLES